MTFTDTTSPPPATPGQLLTRLTRETRLPYKTIGAALGVSRVHVTLVANGHKRITARMAVKLEAVFGEPAQTWIALQGQLDLMRARAVLRDQLPKLRRLI